LEGRLIELPLGRRVAIVLRLHKLLPSLDWLLCSLHLHWVLPALMLVLSMVLVQRATLNLLVKVTNKILLARTHLKSIGVDLICESVTRFMVNVSPLEVWSLFVALSM
jgi:hypothetical protein